MATAEKSLLPLLQARREALEREKRILSARIARLNRQVTATPAGMARWRLFASQEQLRCVCELLLEAAATQGEAAAQRQEDVAQLAQDNAELVGQLRAEEAKTAFLLEKVGEGGGRDGELAEFLRRQLEVAQSEKMLLRLQLEERGGSVEGSTDRSLQHVSTDSFMQQVSMDSFMQQVSMDSFMQQVSMDSFLQQVSVESSQHASIDNPSHVSVETKRSDDASVEGSKLDRGDAQLASLDATINATSGDATTNATTNAKPQRTPSEKPWTAARRVAERRTTEMGPRTPQRPPKPPVTIGNYAALEKKRSIVSYKPKLQDTSISMEDLQLPALPPVLQEKVERGSRKRSEEDSAVPLEEPETKSAKIPKSETETRPLEEAKTELTCRCRGKCASRKCPCRSNGKKCSASCSCSAGRCVNRRASSSSMNETTVTESSLVV